MKYILNFFSYLGDYVIFLIRIFLSLPKFFKRFPEITRQMKRIGYDSFILISITSAFTGFVTSVQAIYQTSGYIPKSFIGVMVGKSTMIELAPVLTALVLAGKVGASIAAEIGTMNVSEQLDALKTLAIEPEEYVFFPRIISGLIMVPILTIYANFVGILSAFVLSKIKYKISAFIFFNNMKNFFLPTDIWGGLIKACVFGLIITSIACYTGKNTTGGAEGVGKSATLTVVYSSILILITDFLVAAILFGNFGL